jgi:predicted nuclease of predicted toxin-antitoxin system
MAIALYLDHHVPRAIAIGLRLRGVDVLTAQEDGSSDLDDSAVLDRASLLGRVLVTQDDDFLSEAARRDRAGIAFLGVIYAHQMRISIGDTIRDLDLIAKAGSPDDMLNRVEYLPLGRRPQHPG